MKKQHLTLTLICFLIFCVLFMIFILSNCKPESKGVFIPYEPEEGEEKPPQTEDIESGRVSAED